MFGRNLKRRDEIQLLAGFFGDYPMLIHRLDKKIGVCKV
jgi:hypothetical protein